MKKIRRLKRFLGVSAIMLAILLANIPFTSTAEDVSGNNTGTTTAGTEASGGAVITPPAFLGVQDTRTDKRGNATATFTSISQDFTLQVADAPAENLDATGFTDDITNKQNTRNFYETAFVLNAVDKEGNAIGNATAFAGGTVTIPLPRMMNLGRVRVISIYKVANGAASAASTGGKTWQNVNLQNISSSAFNQANGTVTLTQIDPSMLGVYVVRYAGYSVDIQNQVKQGGYVTSVDVALGPTDFWKLTVTEIDDDLSNVLKSSSINKDDYTAWQAYNIKLSHNATINGNTTEELLTSGDFGSRCTLTMVAPNTMNLKYGTLKVYGVKTGGVLEELSVTYPSKMTSTANAFDFNTTHFSEFTLLYTQTSTPAPTPANPGTGGGQANGSQNSNNNNQSNAQPATTTETVAATETDETERLEMAGEAQVPPTGGNGGSGKGGNVDMPKTGDADTYRYVGVIMLLLFGFFELISSIPKMKTVS